MIRGLSNLAQRFLAGRPPVGQTPSEVVFRENKWRLLRYLPMASGPRLKTPILLVPSLINRHYVLDLLKGRSFAEYLVGQGHHVFIVDWGAPEAEDRYLDFDTITDRYLGRAIRAACRAAGVGSLHLLGYCLGGTLAAIHTAVRPEHVATLTALAAPIGFRNSGLLSQWTTTKTFDLDALVDAFGNIPWPLMQASFELLKPTLNLVKGVQLLDRAKDDHFLDGFFAVEAWGHDNISFPGECYRHYIRSLYREDALLQGTLMLSGAPVRLEAIRCPTLAVTFVHDHIVPAQSAAVLLDRVSAKERERIHLPGGHVGAVVSQRAAKTLWPALSSWWEKHEQAAPIARPTKLREAGGQGMKLAVSALSMLLLLCVGARPGWTGTWSSRTVAQVNVLLYRPSSPPLSADGRCLLVALHGCAQSNTALKDRGNFEAAAERFGAIVALPAVPGGGVLAGCWDYYGTLHTRANRHNGPLISATQALAQDADLEIDPRQVYVAGLSSGGGEAMVAGCLAPDVFAGVGINAGPTVGTESSQISRVATNDTTATALCRRLAGNHAIQFTTQLAAVIAGSNDFLVAQGYAQLNAEVMAELYRGQGPPLQESDLNVEALDGYQPKGRGKWWSDANGERISWILADGMGHAFPAGSGPGGETSFVASEGVNWPMHLLAHFTQHARRSTALALDAGTGDTEAPEDAEPRRDATTQDPLGSDSGRGRDSSFDRADAEGRPDPVDAAGLSGDTGVLQGEGSKKSEEGGCSCRTTLTRAQGGSSVWLLILLVAISRFVRPRQLFRGSCQR